MNLLDKVFESYIKYFDVIKKNNYLLYLQCYKLDNDKNDFRYIIDTKKKYPILCSVFCTLDSIKRDSYYLIINLKIINIKFKTIFYKELIVNSIITIKKFIFDVIKTGNIFDNYYELNKENIYLFDSIKKDAYVECVLLKNHK